MACRLVAAALAMSALVACRDTARVEPTHLTPVVPAPTRTEPEFPPGVDVARLETPALTPEEAAALAAAARLAADRNPTDRDLAARGFAVPPTGGAR
jgi:hypothetical protein